MVEIDLIGQYLAPNKKPAIAGFQYWVAVSAASGSAFAITFVFGPSGQDDGGVHGSHMDKFR